MPEKISICFQVSEHTFQCLCVYRILKKHVFLIQKRLIIIWSLVIGHWAYIWARELTNLLEWPPNNSFPGCNFQGLYNKSTFIKSAIYSDLRGRRRKGIWREGKGRGDRGETERAPSPLTFLSCSITLFFCTYHSGYMCTFFLFLDAGMIKKKFHFSVRVFRWW